MSSPRLNCEVLCGLDSSVARCNPVAVACARLRLALLDQETASVVTDGLEPIAPTALRADEVHTEAVDAGLDLAEPGEGLLAANALEHADGVPPTHYRPVTPTTLSNIKPPREPRTKLPGNRPMPNLAQDLRLDEVPSELSAVEKGIFDAAKFSPLAVEQLSPRKRTEIDGVHDQIPSLELPDFNPVCNTVVLARSHVLLDAAHSRPTGVPDRPIVAEQRFRVKIAKGWSLQDHPTLSREGHDRAPLLAEAPLTQELLSFHPTPCKGPEHSLRLGIHYRRSHARNQERHNAQARLLLIESLASVDQYHSVARLESPTPATASHEVCPDAARLIDLDIHPLPLWKRFLKVYQSLSGKLGALRHTPKLKCSSTLPRKTGRTC